MALQQLQLLETLQMVNIADNKTVTGATINATAGTSGGADKTAFAWTGYNF